MKVVITSDGPSLDAPVSMVFARAPYFILYDLATDRYEAHQNPASGAFGGAGPMAANFVSSLGAKALVTGGFPGPNAQGVIMGLGIEVIQFQGLVKDAVSMLKSRYNIKPLTKEEELKLLKEEKAKIEARLKEIEERLGNKQ